MFLYVDKPQYPVALKVTYGQTIYSPKGVTALAWHCRLSMQAAVKVQIQLGQIAPSAALRPTGGGYPLSEEAMRWQLEFFGGVVAPVVH